MQHQEFTALEAVLDQYVRPSLRAHGGDIAIQEVSGGTVRCALTGRCAHCPAAAMTTETLVQDALCEHLPWVSQVLLIENTSPDLLRQARAILSRHGR